MLAHFHAALKTGGWKIHQHGSLFPQTTACAAGAGRRAGGNTEYDDEYTGGEHEEYDQSGNSGTDEGTLS